MSEAGRAMTERLLAADHMTDPHGWIQWKGTEVCMDVWCDCGGSFSHVDATFAYFFRCQHCKKLWAVGQCVRLHALTPAEAAYVEANCDGAIVTDENYFVETT